MFGHFAPPVFWTDPAVVPNVAPGNYGAFIVAYRSKHTGKVYTREAHYLNKMVLDWEDDESKYCDPDDGTGETTFSGWHFNEPRDDADWFTPCGDILAWCEHPKFEVPA